MWIDRYFICLLAFVWQSRFQRDCRLSWMRWRVWSFLILHVIGVLLTRVDAHILAVYRRHIHYQKYYAAQPGIHAKVPTVKPSVPVYQGHRGWV